VAEDDLHMRKLVADALRKDGYEVVELADGERLYAQVTHHLISSGELDVDLLVSDLRMPGKHGLDVAEVVRGVSADLPMILMTAFGDHETRERITSLRAVPLDKPFPMSALRREAARLLCRDADTPR
jgi:CheY-like chemotaxis protein